MAPSTFLPLLKADEAMANIEKNYEAKQTAVEANEATTHDLQEKREKLKRQIAKLEQEAIKVVPELEKVQNENHALLRDLRDLDTERQQWQEARELLAARK